MLLGMINMINSFSEPKKRHVTEEKSPSLLCHTPKILRSTLFYNNLNFSKKSGENIIPSLKNLNFLSESLIEMLMMLHYSEVFRLTHISLSSPENLLMNIFNIQYSIVIIPSRFSLFNQQKQLGEKMKKRNECFITTLMLFLHS